MIRLPMEPSLRPRWLALMLVGCLTMFGCEKAPHDELQAAETAVREARQLRAPIYAPEAFSELEGMLASAKEEIETQYKQSEFKRDYTRARDLLARTRTEADRIIAEAEKRKEEARVVALREREQAEEAVQEVRKLLARVEEDRHEPTGGVPEELKAEAEELDRTLAEVKTAIEANNHLVAKEKAKAVQKKSLQLQSEMQASGK